MKYDVVALGELLVDLTQAGLSAQGNPLYEANPGGAPCNVLAMLQKLGKKTAFAGKVGDDLHGRFLVKAAQGAGIDTSPVVLSPMHDTTLAFVALAEDGDREFAFIRRNGADTALSADEVPESLLADCAVFHFGSLSLTHEPARAATVAAVGYAKKHGCLITFDPNLRPPLWDSLDEAREQMLWGCGQCSVLKLAKEELLFITGEAGLQAGAAEILRRFGNIGLLLVTDGKNGAYAYYEGQQLFSPTFLEVKTIDTTGAGDTFMGYCIDALLDSPLSALNAEKLGAILRSANAAASLVTTKKGALCNMPSKEEIEQLIAAHKD